MVIICSQVFAERIVVLVYKITPTGRFATPEPDHRDRRAANVSHKCAPSGHSEGQRDNYFLGEVNSLPHALSSRTVAMENHMDCSSREAEAFIRKPAAKVEKKRIGMPMEALVQQFDFIDTTLTTKPVTQCRSMHVRCASELQAEGPRRGSSPI